MKRIIILCAVALPSALNAQFSWEQRADLPIDGLYGAASFVIGDFGYIVSGKPDGDDVADVWMYDMENDVWIPKAPIPQARRFAAGFAINGKGYVACGAVGGSIKLNDLWEYDPVNDSWTSKADFPGDPRYGTCYFTLGGLGYVGTGNIGTSSGPYVSDMYAYDPNTDYWIQKASMPGLPRYGTSTMTADGRAYVFGGLMSNQEHTGDIYEYDPTNDTWLLREPLPGSTRTYAMALSYAHNGVIAAGKSGAGVNIYDGFSYIPNIDTWSPIPTYPGESGWVGSTMAIDGRSFGGLGYTLADSHTHNDWWELVKLTDGIIELGKDGHGVLIVFPNPVASGSVLSLEQDQIADLGSQVSMSICTSVGSEVYSGNFRNGRVITCPELAEGSYVLRLRGQQGRSAVGKFVVVDESR